VLAHIANKALKRSSLPARKERVMERLSKLLTDVVLILAAIGAALNII